MTTSKLKIWGRDLELKIHCRCYEDQEPSPAQQQTLAWFCGAQDVIDSALDPVKKYILNDEQADASDDPINNIFYYVMPTTIFVPRDQEKGGIALLCNYRFDPEHGLAVVFEEQKYKTTGPQDIIL